MKTQIRAFVKSVPLVSSLVHLLKRPGYFKGSAQYWERRYQTGGNSGPGSHNRLAEFKASFLNRFVDRHQITSVIEYGSGDGTQTKLAHYPSYTGVDVSAKAVEICRTLFAGDTSKRFLQLDSIAAGSMADLSLSLDVIYHLVEDPVYEAYMRLLFESARKFVISYSSNMDQNWPQPHVRHRQFTRWVEQEKPEWYLESVVKNIYPYNPADPEQTSLADFYVFGRRRLP